MDVARPVLADEPRMSWRDVADMGGEAVARIERVHAEHRPVADDLGHDRRRGDRCAPFVTVDDRDVLGRRRPQPETVDEAGLGRRRQSVECPSQPVQVRAVQTGAVDLTRGIDLYRHPRRGCEKRAEQLLSILGRDLLRIVQLREWPNAWSRPASYEQDAGDDGGPAVSLGRLRQPRRRSERRAFGRTSAASAPSSSTAAGSSASGSAPTASSATGCSQISSTVGLLVDGLSPA